MVNIKCSRATFTADDQPDVLVEVHSYPTGDMNYIVNRDDVVLHTGVVSADQHLQSAEALQFVADTIGSTVPGRLSPFVRGWIGTSADANHIASKNGFWDEDRNNGEMLCLVHSEISEALEALRQGNQPDEKLPEFDSVEVELADAVIRIMDMAHVRGWRVAQAVEAKMKFNANRPYKHGKEF